MGLIGLQVRGSICPNKPFYETFGVESELASKIIFTR